MRDMADQGRLAVLAAGLRWLYEVEQPVGAILQHHGAGLQPVVAARRYRAAPAGWADLPVISVEVVGQRWIGTGRTYRCENPLEGRDEMAEIAAAIESLGVLVRRLWNGGEGAVHASFSLARPAHPSLVAAVHRYRAGCPEHGGVFCGTGLCGWWPDGHALAVRPDAAVVAT